VATGVVIPTIFTPNGDGKNDTFFITDLSYFPGSQLSVFNRWGNEVYRSNDYQNNWDGAGLSDGTYYYTLKRKEKSGTMVTHKGWIYLRR
jgi:gliding motility-associated-like protein